MDTVRHTDCSSVIHVNIERMDCTHIAQSITHVVYVTRDTPAIGNGLSAHDGDERPYVEVRRSMDVLVRSSMGRPHPSCT